MRRFLKMLMYEIRSSARDIRPMLCGLLLALFVVAAVKPLTTVLSENSQDTISFRIALVDQEDSLYTRLVVSHIQNAPSVADGITVVAATADEALEMMNRNEIPVAVFIPEGFVSSMQGGETKEITVLLNNKMPFQASLVSEGIHRGMYLMSAVQNVLYVVYSGLLDAGVDGDTANQLFNTQMLAMVSDALSRAEMFDTEHLTPWQGGMIAYYMASALLAYLCVLGIYHIYRKDSIHRSHFRDRIVSLNRSGALVEATDILGSVLMMYVPCAVLFTVISVVCRFPGQSYIPALLTLFAVCVHICSVNHLFLRRMGGTAVLPAIMLVLHFALLALAGCIIPHDYLLAGAKGSPWFNLIPHYVWHTALYLPAQGPKMFGQNALLPIGLSVLYGFLPFGFALLRGQLRLKRRVS